MAARRNLLHITKLRDFAAWATTAGWRETPVLPNRYEVLRLRRHDGNGVTLVYHQRLKGEHVTAHGEGLELVEQYFEERDDA